MSYIQTETSVLIQLAYPSVGYDLFDIFNVTYLFFNISRHTLKAFQPSTSILNFVYNEIKSKIQKHRGQNKRLLIAALFIEAVITVV